MTVPNKEAVSYTHLDVYKRQDEGCSEAVKEVFVRLYDKGLIYRGNRMVNWCPHCNLYLIHISWKVLPKG